MSFSDAIGPFKLHCTYNGHISGGKGGEGIPEARGGLK